MLYAQIHLTLPPWVLQTIEPNKIYADDESRMQLAIDLSATNIDRRSGGPFGAAIFTEEGRLVSVGVNRVEAMNCSAAHAEIMAFSLAQMRMQSFRLNQQGSKMILATSAQPCCQCYGASFWAGIDRMLIGARAEDVELLTEFREGPLPQDWIGELNKRGIEVRRDLLRDQACKVLADYTSSGGAMY